MKKNFTKDFEEITSMVNSIRTLNEAINFNESYDDEDMIQDEYMEDEEGDYAEGEDETVASQAVEAANGEAGGVINQIRELTLKGMVALCNNPESAEYQTLKKIFTFCDKAVIEKDDEMKK